MRFVVALLALIGVAPPALAQDFPVTLEHVYGATTVSEAPKRVLSVGMHEQDFLYALGIAPVGVKEWWGDHPYATWPWAEEARKAVDAAPEVMNADGINLEWVAAQKPDLIVAIYVDMDEQTYLKLSQIAPTVVTPEGFTLWTVPWRDEFRFIDRATSGNTTKSDAVIAGFDQRFAEVRATYPQLAGKTGTNVYFDPSTGFTAWGSSDLASRFLLDLGLTFPPALDKLAQADNRVSVSPELIDLLEMDVAVWPLDTAEQQAAVESLGTYQSLKLAREGRSVWLRDGDGLANAAMSWQTPLALGYLLDILPAKLAAAVDGDPATPVP
jgi:iron complex transport system substrate-binding protein